MPLSHVVAIAILSYIDDTYPTTSLTCKDNPIRTFPVYISMTCHRQYLWRRRQDRAWYFGLGPPFSDTDIIVKCYQINRCFYQISTAIINNLTKVGGIAS